MKQLEDARGSFLATLPAPLAVSLRQQSVVHHFRGGATIVSEADGRWTGIVLSGLARVYLRTEAGRQVTIRHARRGDSIGIGTLLGESLVSAQAVTDCTVMQLDPEQVVRLARTHQDLALAIAREVSTVLVETQREIVIREQASVRQRIARHLLTYVGEVDAGKGLVVAMSHDELADSVGTAREVVTRHLDRFQAEGMVILDRGQITLVNPAGLDDAANSEESAA